jgi:hypothetical protein
MAAAKISEKHSLNVEGTLDITDSKIEIEVITEEDTFKKNLSELLIKFNGELVKISVVKKIDIA